jgi:hypothetical protein
LLLSRVLNDAGETSAAVSGTHPPPNITLERSREP